MEPWGPLSPGPFPAPLPTPFLAAPDPPIAPGEDTPRVVGSMSESPCQAVTISGFFSKSAKFFQTLMAPSSWGEKRGQSEPGPGGPGEGPAEQRLLRRPGPAPLPLSGQMLCPHSYLGSGAGPRAKAGMGPASLTATSPVLPLLASHAKNNQSHEGTRPSVPVALFPFPVCAPHRGPSR